VAKVRLELEHLSRGLTRVLLAEDRVPYGLGPSPRFVISRLPGGRRAAVTYSLRTVVRGRYEIGPLQLTLGDPFGLCELTRSFTATDPLTVVPTSWPLTGLPPGGQWSGTGESAHGTAAASGEHDVAVREYRHGDDLRRVHWPSSARHGELMVRRDEQPRERRATVLLDSRADAHGGDGPSSSFEWAVCAAASAAVSLSDQRYAVRLLTDGAAMTWTPARGGSGAVSLLDRLATVTLAADNTLSPALSTLDRSHGDGLVVAVIGDLPEDAAAALARVRRSGTSAVALMLRSWEWDGHDGATGPAHTRHERCRTLLRAAGWHVASVSPADTVPAVWQRALAGGPARGERTRRAPLTTRLTRARR
jgi:uncharacterized protein (DUF58 family)